MNKSEHRKEIVALGGGWWVMEATTCVQTKPPAAAISFRNGSSEMQQEYRGRHTGKKNNISLVSLILDIISKSINDKFVRIHY